MNSSQNFNPSTPFTDYDFSNFYFDEGDDVYSAFQKYANWWDSAYPGGYHVYREPFSSAPDPVISIKTNMGKCLDGLLNLSSFNYLGMSNSEVVKDAAIKAIQHYGLGSAGGPNLSGMYDVHRALEREVASFKKKERCTTFTSGYAANLGVISGIMRAGDTILLDQYSHASLVDGATLSKANMVFFRHNNAADLERKLQAAKGRKLVVVEGIYSMDGDISSLPEIVEISKKHGARILIDEAHSAFAFGENGRGVVEHYNLEDEVDFHMGTFSKSLGCLGGYVCGSNDFIEYLEAYARSRFFSTTMPPALSASILASLRFIQDNPVVRQKLWQNVKYLQNRFKDEGIDFGNSTSQVMPIMVGNDTKVFKMTERFREEGIFIQPVVYPAVSKGKARFRISVTSLHTIDQLEFAVQKISNVYDEYSVLRKKLTI
jgi:glycine C-acetyltransferase